MSEENSFLVFSGTKTRYLAEKICASLGCPLGNSLMTRFSDGEFVVSYEQSIRGKDIYLVQSTFPNSDNLMELLLMIDAAKACICPQHHCRYSLFWLGASGQKRQTTCEHWCKIGCRLAQGSRYRPSYYNGFTRRPDSRILRCACGSPLCKRCVASIFAEPALERYGNSQS